MPSFFRSSGSFFLATVAALLLVCTFVFLGLRAHSSLTRPTEAVSTLQRSKQLNYSTFEKPNSRISLMRTTDSFREVILDLGMSVPSITVHLNLSIPYRYHRVLPAKCWIGDCRGRNNWRAYRPCADATASEYNVLGVITIERMLNSPLVPTNTSENEILERAAFFFRAALKLDPKCLSASMNLAMVYLKTDNTTGIKERFSIIPELLSKNQSYDLALIKSLDEFVISRNEPKHVSHRNVTASWKSLYAINNATIFDYRGAFLHFSKDMDVARKPYMYKHLVSMIFWKYFAETSLLQYSMFSPSAADDVAREGWTVLRNVFPAYLFEAYRQCSMDVITDHTMPVEDRAHGRMQLVNDRCSVFMCGQLTDVVSLLGGTQAQPTFVKIASYTNTSHLQKHTDNDLCVWTISLTVNMTSSRLAKDFPLGLVDYQRKEVVSELYENDGMLLMGNALPHFRQGSIPKRETLIQTFFHWKEEEGLLKPISQPARRKSPKKTDPPR